MTNYIQTNQTDILSVNAAASLLNLISEADSGKTLIYNAQNAIQTYTLPLPKKGLRYRFEAGATLGFDVTIASNPAGRILGKLINMSSAVAAVGTAIVFEVMKDPGNSVIMSATASFGDYVDLNSDGVNWYVIGWSSNATHNGLA